MKITSAELWRVCGVSSAIPDTGKPEIALVGRSNVGKSSFINTVLVRKKLAHTSSIPGKTQTVNYYEINHDFYLVDLPGYGYATATPDVKKQWQAMVTRYLLGSRNLTAVLLLIDIRHEPKDTDMDMLRTLDRMSIPVYVIATKKDKLSRSEVPRQVRMLTEAVNHEIIPFSSLSKDGIEEVYGLLDRLLSPADMRKQVVSAEE